MDTTIVKRYCSNGHKFQVKPTFIPCCLQASKHIKRRRRYRQPSNGRSAQKRRQRAHAFLKLRDRGLCRYCGEPGVEVDHVMPRCSNGSESAFGNMVWCCRRCNGVKGAKEGFNMKNSRLYYEGQLIAPSHLFGAELLQRLQTG
ncbi:hypothetical protein LCGC14_0532610 [marine sediment metagenome]|uniref:HNH nuclease domain-containing protein n=1 Tax=marine sediment metagenome TaxID=412755 RepID=A0A0F9SDR1_9ZZZZ